MTCTFKTTYSESGVQKMVKSIQPSEVGPKIGKSGWYHTFKFGDVLTKEARTTLDYQMWCAQGIPLDLRGKSVLDIGAADGFHSFLCEQRGAKRVLAIDIVHHPGFDVAKKILNSNVEYCVVSVLPNPVYRKMGMNDLDDIKETFDIVLLFGVYYHLENPLLALQKIFQKTNNTLFLSGHIIDTEEPLMCYYDEYEMHPYDPSNWWVASPSCILGMAKRIGFKNCEMLGEMKDEKPFLPHKIQNSIRDLTKVGTFKLSK